KKRVVTPASVLALSDEAMRAAGLSAAKSRSLRDLAEKVHSKAVPLADLDEASDEEVIAALIPVRGIGRWTAQMFLIFALGRLDVLPLDDYGLRAGVMENYNLNQLPTRKELMGISTPWRPYATVATWYIWRSRGFVPQSE